MLQTGGCHFDKWIVPTERNYPDVFMRDLIDCTEDNPYLGQKQANLFKIDQIDKSFWMIMDLNGVIKKRPEIASGLLLYLSLKGFYVSSYFQIDNSTCPGCHSSMFRQHIRNRLLHDDSTIWLQTYRPFPSS